MIVNDQILNAIIAACRRRAAEGGCLHTEPHSGEALENAVIELADKLEAAKSGPSADRVDYLKRLIVGIREEIEKHSTEIHGDKCTPSEWVDAWLLCSVVEKEILGVEKLEGE